MNRIDKQLQKIKDKKRVGLMTHVVVGYPSIGATRDIVKLMATSGVDFIELQIPFSDPLADGPTIMHACDVALKNGTKVKDAFVLAGRLTQEVEIPILFMGYYNTVFKYGVEKFCEDAKKAGIAGFIIPDMPYEEEVSEGFFASCDKHGLYPVRVVSPASTNDRLEKNSTIAKGFVYCTARQGTTGASKEMDPNVVSFLNRVRSYITLPLAVGFGISKREHIEMLAPHVEVAVIGSAVIDLIRDSSHETLETRLSSFITSLVGVEK